MGSKRRIFTPEYKAEAAHLVIDTGRSIAEVAREIDVCGSVLGRWVEGERRALALEAHSGLSRSERAELEHLRRENRDLRADNEFLGKAAAFFAERRRQRSAAR